MSSVAERSVLTVLRPDEPPDSLQLPYPETLKAAINSAVADATLAMLPRAPKAAAVSLRSLWLWAVAGAVGVALHASTMVSAGPRQSSMLMSGWAPAFTQVRPSASWTAVLVDHHYLPAGSAVACGCCF
jgi:hypothetical protein